MSNWQSYIPQHLKQTPSNALFWQDTRPSLFQSIEAIAWLTSVLLTLFIIDDWLSNRANFATLLSIKIASIVLQLGLIGAIRTTRGKVYAEPIFLTAGLLLFVSIIYQADIIGEMFMVPFSTIFGTSIVALMLPWRIFYQMMIVSIAWFGIIINIVNLSDSSQFTLEQISVAGFVFTGTSIFFSLYTNERRFELWQAQSTMREGEERFRQLGEHSQDIIWIWSPTRQIEYISPAYEQFTGDSPQSLYDNAFLVMDKVHPDDHVSFGQAIEDVIQGEFRKMDLRVRHPNGNYYHLEGWGSPIRNKSGQVVRCVGIWRDVSERVQFVEELNAYAHTVAHDLKNPIGVILGYAAFLESDLEEVIGADHTRFIQTITRMADKMTSIIDELLLLANIRDMEEVETANLDMRDVMQSTQERFVKHIVEKQAEMVIPETWHSAIGYAPWVEEVWANYIGNALKYGGTPPRIEVGSTPEPATKSVRFWVKDNGAGLNAEEQAKVFVKFSRLETERAEGQGLGLSIVQRIIEKLGGEVGVESQTGQGSEFYFKLPAVEL